MNRKIIVVALSLLIGRHLAAQTTDTTIYCPISHSPIRIALPKTNLDTSIDQAIADEIRETFRDTLEDSGLFKFHGPAEMSVLKLTGHRGHDFDQYRALGNQLVLLTTIIREDDHIVLEGQLYDLPSRQPILDQLFVGEPTQAQHLAYRVAEAVLTRFSAPAD